MSKTLGQKIKQYRTEKGLSQLDLELEIGTSPGRISKIENDKINPDKETIVFIAKALELDTPAIASLFGLKVVSLAHLSKDIQSILINKSPEEIIDTVVNEIVFKLGYIASAIFIKEDNSLYMRGLTKTNISEKVLPLLPKPLGQISLSLTNDLDNLTVRAINEGKKYMTHYTYEYIVPMVNKQIADEVQSVAGDKSNLIVPLIVDEQKLGAIVYVKKVKSDFDGEIKTLRLVTDIVAASLFNAQKINKLNN